MNKRIQRRRFVSVIAGFLGAGASAAAPARALTSAATKAVQPVQWRGIAMGALASMTIVDPDRTRARTLLERCVAEIDRLESIFSLYRADSALCRLNVTGRLADPPFELVELLSQALALAQASGGAFDPSVQAIYRLYALHFARPGAAPGGPPPRAIEHALRLVDHRAVEVDSRAIVLHRPGMALTLNGIAQGYVTDRIVDLLRAAGLRDLLVDLGELRASGQSDRGGAWHAAVADPRNPGRQLFALTLGEGTSELGERPAALATSAAAGTPLDAHGRIHHLFDARTGRSANRYLSVTVGAPRASLADGLSTALSALTPNSAETLLARYPDTQAWMLDAQGRMRRFGL